MESYIGKLANGIVEANILFAVNFMFKGNSTIEERRNLEESGHAVKMFPQTPVIESETGYRVMYENEDICSESSESLIYLMQNLRVGDLNCLTFYASGANTHLIDGQLARLEELQLISNKAIALGVIGGGSIRMEYGSFRFNLGPGEDGKYHEITAVGMDKVSSGFGEYNLQEVIKEYTEIAQGDELEYVLPQTVGGTKVHLLLGIKKTRIQPILLRVLPSGVGVYQENSDDILETREVRFNSIGRIKLLSIY